MGTSLQELRNNVMASGSVLGDGMARAIPPGRMAQVTSDPLVNLWVSRASQYDQYALLFQPDWTRYWRYYRAWRQPLTEPLDWWRSNEVIPTCFKIIETLYPKYLFGLFDSPDWFNVKGTEQTDELWELAITSLMKEQLEEMGVISPSCEALKYCAIMGHVWGKVTWKEEWQTRSMMEPQLVLDPELGIPTGQTAYSKTTITDKIADRPNFEWVSLDRIKTSTNGDGRWYIEEIKTTLEELHETNERMGGIYSNLDNVQGMTGASMTTSPWFTEPQSTEGIPQWMVEHKDGTPVSLWQCWGWIPPQYRRKGESDWRLVVIANKGTVIRNIDAPTPDGKPPYFPIKCIPIPGRLFGDSILRYIGPLADQQTRLANHRLDEVMLSVWGQMVIDDTSGITSNEMFFQPGGALFVRGSPADKVMVLQRQRMDPMQYREDAYRQEQAEHAAGATDIMQGLNANDRSTAQEINAKLTQSGMRITAEVLWLQETFIKPLLRRVYEYLQMRMPAEKIQRVIASDGVIYDVPLDIKSLQIPIDIVISGGLLGLSKNSRLQDFQEMIGLGGNPAYAPFLRVDEVLREYYRSKGIRNVDRFVKTMQEVMAERFASAQMAAPPSIPGLGSGQPAPGGGQGPPSGMESMQLPPGSSGPGMDQGAGASVRGVDQG